MRALWTLVVVAGATAASGCSGSADAPSPAAAPLWSEPITLATPSPPPSADVAERPDGTAIAVWTERTGSASRPLAAERDRSGTWAAGGPIAPLSPTPIQGLRVVVDPAGMATAVWALWDRPQGQVYAFVQASRQNRDGNWQAPVTLSRGTNGLTEVLATARDDGRLVVVWSGSRRRNGSYVAEVRSASRSPRGRWSFARVAGIGAGDPFLAANGLASGEGDTRLIWMSFRRRGFPGGILTSTFGADERWSAPRRLIGAGRQLSDLTVASGSDGAMTAVWRRRGDGTLRVVHSTRADWTAPRLIAGGAAEPDPLVVAGSGGGALVVLERWRPRGGRASLQVARVRRDGTVTTPRAIATRVFPPATGGGEPWPIPWAPTAVLAPDGGAVVAWPRSGRRADRVVVASAIVARRASRAGRWGDRETVADLARPAIGVFPSLAILSSGELQMRWRTGEGEPTLLSTSTS